MSSQGGNRAGKSKSSHLWICADTEHNVSTLFFKPVWRCHFSQVNTQINGAEWGRFAALPPGCTVLSLEIKEEMKQDPEGFIICSSLCALISATKASQGELFLHSAASSFTLCFNLDSETDNRVIGLNRRIVDITNSEGRSFLTPIMWDARAEKGCVYLNSAAFRPLVRPGDVNDLHQ